jgi:large subunit ribosomal protein L22
MDIHASLRYLRMSPRKVRLVIDTIRGLSVTEAETRLRFMKKQAAEPVLKLLRSAIANAQHNAHLEKAGLVVQKITADGGPTIKRSRPRAFGRAAAIRKRTTHIEIVLAPAAAVKTKTHKRRTKPSAPKSVNPPTLTS